MTIGLGFYMSCVMKAKGMGKTVGNGKEPEEKILKKGECICADSGKRYQLLKSASSKEVGSMKIYRIAQVKELEKEEIYFMKCAYTEDFAGVYNLQRENKFRFYYPYIEHVLEGFYAIDSRGERLFCVIFECIEGADLRTYRMRKKNEMQGRVLEKKEFERNIFQQMMQFLYGVRYYTQFTRNDPYLHRDLRPENIMINDEGNVVIVDFDIAHVPESTGTSQWMEGMVKKAVIKGDEEYPEHQMDDVGGLGETEGYSAPEICASLQNRISKKPDVKSDIYSIGRVFFYWLHGKDYFSDEQRGEWDKLCKRGEEVYGMDFKKFDKEYQSETYEELRKIMSRMCARRDRRYNDISDIITDMKKFLIKYCERLGVDYEEYIRRDQMPLLHENLRYKSIEAPNVICEVVTAKGRYKRGKVLLNHTMRDITVEKSLVMTIYNVDGNISFIPYEKDLHRIRQGDDYEIYSEEQFMMGENKIIFYIH